MSIQIEQQGRVVIVRLNRPQALNALNSEMMFEIVGALQELERDPEVGCFVLTGNEKAFAAGADIKELASKSYMDMLHEDFFCPLGSVCGPAHTQDCSGGRVCIGRRLRIGDDV